MVGALVALLVLAPAAATLALPAPVTASEPTWDIRQISVDERRRLLAGEIVPFQVAERTDRDLAAGMMVYVATPLARVTEHLAESELAVREPGIAGWGALSERAGPDALAKLRLGLAEADELMDA